MVSFETSSTFSSRTATSHRFSVVTAARRSMLMWPEPIRVATSASLPTLLGPGSQLQSVIAVRDSVRCIVVIRTDREVAVAVAQLAAAG